jgi:hypothetical protein
MTDATTSALPHLCCPIVCDLDMVSVVGGPSVGARELSYSLNQLFLFLAFCSVWKPDNCS